ncbi:MAG TPA: nuclease-related domain-containing protein [Symbiobacteriaceae bacterium]|nr:nuclease-related domain-containing protein [Symbiobacteriaceae bacterium]
MATTIMPTRPGLRRRAWRLFGCVALSLCATAASLLTHALPARWAGLALIPITGWCCVDWLHARSRYRARRSIGARLSRLPDDFYLLNDLVIPSPWGEIQMDQVVISRYGIAVIGAGPAAGSLPERVEAVRSLLFTYGLTRPSLAVRGLVLLPPGSQPPRQIQYGVPTLRVEHLRLHHLAPSHEPVLSHEQVATIAQCLLQARAVS